MTFAPFLRSAVTLVALVVIYQVYVLTIAPLVEPPAIARSNKTVTDQQRRGSYEAIDRYQALLAAYFPADHWSLVTAPKVIRVDELMFVLKDYQRHDNGSIDLEECAILVLPKDWQLGAAPPRETIILEAPGGAHLQFDDDFQPARGKAGRIVKGEFPGELVIRSDMKLPGPEDDLFITTRDLVMNETLIRTEAAVKARLGQNRGSGRKMVIRLSRDEHIKRGPSINGVQSLEIYEDVELELQGRKFDLLGDEPDKMAKQPQRLSAAPANLPAASRQRLSNIRLTAAHVPEGESEFDPPVQITCQGRFHFDLLDYVASFDQNVEVRRMRLDGPFDQLDCNELSVQFAAIDENGNPIDSRDDPDVARKQRAAAGSFRPIAIEATGNPVRAQSTVGRAEAAQQAAARAQRMRIHLLDQRITLDGGREVMLAYGASEIHAPLIEYQLPPADSPRSVGELSISGPGWLRAVPDKLRPDRVVDVAWKRAEGLPYSVSIRRRQGEPVLLLAGEPVIDAHRLGKVQAERLELVLREVPGDGPEGPALELTRSPTKLAVIPERLLAAGKVAFASRELTGRTHQLEATFEPWKPKQQIRAAASQTGVEVDRRRHDGEPPSSQYDLVASQIHLDLALSGQRAQPTTATCEGSVVLREVRTRRSGDEPVVVKGDRLRVDGLEQQAKISVTGRADPSGLGGATIDARGLRLIAERIDADQDAGKFWVNGPGRATMNIDGDAFGGTQGESTPVTLTWQTGLDAAGQRVVVKGHVLAESQHGWVQADQVVAHLTRPVKVEKGTAQEKIEVAQVSLEGNVVIDHRDVDDDGQTSHENLQLRSLALNRLTGAIQGTGPGVLRSVRLAESSMSFANLADAGQTVAAQPPAAAANGGSQLRFLRVDFAQGVTGNMDQRVLRFHRRVRSVYGPVDGWQQELPLHNPDRLPPDTVTLGCETLVVNEDPLGARRRQAGGNTLGPVELKAIENVEIEGRSKKQGLFQAEAITASYSQEKDLFVLQGDGQHDAVLRHRDPKTGQFVETPAGTILYWASEPRVQLRDIHSPFDFQQESPRNALRPQN
ncbi:MAG: hypothetical protein ACR2NU_08550 [Aeoliella sp.]